MTCNEDNKFKTMYKNMEMQTHNEIKMIEKKYRRDQKMDGIINKSFRFAGIQKRRWRVPVPNQIPEDFHFEELSTITVVGTAPIVAYRIDECLRIRSIVAKFNSENAEAECKTHNLMVFFVRLYQGPTKNTIVVEVQRWSDCVFDFTKEKNAIFQAAKGGSVVNDSDMATALSRGRGRSAKGSPSKTRKLFDGLVGSAASMQVSKKSRTFEVVSSFKSTTGDYNSDERSSMVLVDDLFTPLTKHELKNMLEGTASQLDSKHLEVQLMALRSLTSMTDTQESHLRTSLQISKLILEGRFGLREKVVSLIHQDLSNSNRNRNIYDAAIREQICLSSLQVMYNALESISDHSIANNNIDTIKVIISEGYVCFSQGLLTALIEAIRDYEMCHTACLAVKCMTCLFRVYPELRDEALRYNALRVLQDAEHHGHGCHLNLESESTNAINIMTAGEGVVC